MKSIINELYQELSRCDYVPGDDHTAIGQFTYNDISFRQGTETYFKKLQGMLSDFKFSVMELPNEMVEDIYNEYKTIKGLYFDIPNDDTIARMKADYRANNNDNLKKSIDETDFILGMVAVQTSTLDDALNFLRKRTGDKPMEPQPIEHKITEKKEESEGTIRGIRELAKCLGVSPTTAQKIVNSKILPKDIQYKVGNCWYFYKEKLMDFVQENPNTMKKCTTIVK